jgi:hypothetical protein
MKTYIVFFGEIKHSVWDNPIDAKHQVDVLESHGYRHVCFHVIDAICLENGKYYV